ncbi:MAG TPA: HAD family phosphatase [Anaerolineaceae bacterium]|nr:HAD family phosphatase [Anaerolineaceae bacterium]
MTHPEPLHFPLTVIFDLGGVLMNWNPRYLYRKLFTSEQAMEHFLTEIDFFKWNHQQDAGRSFATAVAELCAHHPQYSDQIRAYDERYLESLAGPIDETVIILRQLHRHAIPLFGLSNWPAEKFRLVRPLYSFFDCFQDIIVSGEVGVAKPDPKIFEILLEKVGRPAGECLFIDDSMINIETATRLGFQTIHFENATQLQDALVQRSLLSAPERFTA